MADVEFNGETFPVDEDGFIQDFNVWSKNWVQYVKSQEGIDELNEEHWNVINILQDYYKKNSQAPYCQRIIAPKVAKLRQQFITKLKKK